MDEARARRLQPHYIELAFKAAFTRLGGRIARREQGRYEIANVPAHIRASKHGPIATKYDRVTFDLEHVQPDGQARADLLAPGHPLHDAVMDEAIRSSAAPSTAAPCWSPPRWRSRTCSSASSRRSPTPPAQSVARRFGYAYVDSFGTVTPAGPAPYLDCVAAPESAATEAARKLPWLADAEDRAMSWIITNQLPEYLAEVQPRRSAELAKAREPRHQAP